MKKKSLIVTMITSSLLIASPVFAETDSEILFRDIPWGSSFNDTSKLLPEFNLFGSTMDGLNAANTNNVLKGELSGDIGINNNCYSGEICFQAMPMISRDLDVAGYPVYCLYLYYTYSTENGFSLSDDNTILYGAQYEFEEPQNLESMYSDLADKLSTIYGEADDKCDDINDFGTQTAYMRWYGANDTAVALQSYDYDDYPRIYVSYAWLKGDELLKEADAALSADQANTESEIYGNGSTNGL